MTKNILFKGLCQFVVLSCGCFASSPQGWDDVGSETCANLLQVPVAGNAQASLPGDKNDSFEDLFEGPEPDAPKILGEDGAAAAASSASGGVSAVAAISVPQPSVSGAKDKSIDDLAAALFGEPNGSAKDDADALDSISGCSTTAAATTTQAQSANLMDIMLSRALYTSSCWQQYPLWGTNFVDPRFSVVPYTLYGIERQIVHFAETPEVRTLDGTPLRTPTAAADHGNHVRGSAAAAAANAANLNSSAPSAATRTTASVDDDDDLAPGVEELIIEGFIELAQDLKNAAKGIANLFDPRKW